MSIVHFPRKDPPLGISRFRDLDSNFDWVRRYAAIGDSLTAGVGSGSRLGLPWHRFDDWMCSRYDLSWPMLIYNYIGSGIEDFQYTACMGAETPDIYKQVQNLKGDLDLVVMTAGGNDLCLVHIIINCVILAFFGDKECDNILDQAKKNLDNIVKNNIKKLLLGLNPKMRKDGGSSLAMRRFLKKSYPSHCL